MVSEAGSTFILRGLGWDIVWDFKFVYGLSRCQNAGEYVFSLTPDRSMNFFCFEGRRYKKYIEQNVPSAGKAKIREERKGRGINF